ncbi:MAG TPA: hypothetical protein VGL15_14680 [Vicinamibacteria bacterium]|jgi:hypothetical protein
MRLGLIALSVAPTLLAQEPAPLPGKDRVLDEPGVPEDGDQER